MRCQRFLNSIALSTENYLDFQINKILEKNKNWGGVCFLSYYKKKNKTAYLYNGESKLITKKKKTMHTQEMHNLGILYAKITLLSSKREEYFLQKS